MVFSRKDLTDRCHNTSFVMSVPLWLTSIYGQEFDVELNGKIVLRIFKVVIFVTSKQIWDFLDRNMEKMISAAYKTTEKKIKRILCGDTLQSEQTTQYNQRNKLWRI